MNNMQIFLLILGHIVSGIFVTILKRKIMEVRVSILDLIVASILGYVAVFFYSLSLIFTGICYLLELAMNTTIIDFKKKTDES